MSDQTITIRRLGPDDLNLLCSVQKGVFDHPIDRDQARAFLDDPLHEIVLAFEGTEVVGFASGTILLHPDKEPAFFVNEVGTHETWRRRGIATKLTRRLFAIARRRGCDGIWLGTEPDNAPALGLYRRLKGDEREFVGFGWDGALDD